MNSSHGKVAFVARRRLVPEPTEGAFLTVKELAAWLGISHSSVRSWCEQGRLPHYRLESGIRFDPDEIDEWLGERYYPATRD